MLFVAIIKNARQIWQGSFGRSATRLHRLWLDQRGIIGLRFALIVTALLFSVMATFEVGRVVMVQNTLAYAANEATRFAMVHSAVSDYVASEEDIVALVKGRMTGLDTTQAVVGVNWIPENQPGAYVTVDVAYPYALSAFGLGTINLNGSSGTVITH
ncbi:MAG: TadE/TadG family type IV pilus assembly protein [Geminicoccaceae bacterium]